jgi:hypothetical protein
VSGSVANGQGIDLSEHGHQVAIVSVWQVAAITKKACLLEQPRQESDLPLKSKCVINKYFRDIISPHASSVTAVRLLGLEALRPLGGACRRYGVHPVMIVVARVLAGCSARSQRCHCDRAAVRSLDGNLGVSEQGDEAVA